EPARRQEPRARRELGQDRRRGRGARAPPRRERARAHLREGAARQGRRGHRRGAHAREGERGHQRGPPIAALARAGGPAPPPQRHRGVLAARRGDLGGRVHRVEMMRFIVAFTLLSAAAQAATQTPPSAVPTPSQLEKKPKPGALKLKPEEKAKMIEERQKAA